jgi:hypothetical protein
MDVIGVNLDAAQTLWSWGGVREVRAYPETARSFRSVVLLTVLTVLNVFDLAFTQSQLPRGNFAEANALASALVTGTVGMLAYKTLLFGSGAAILYRLRRRWQSEAGLWLLVACYAGLMVWWVAYLRAAEICLSDPAVVAPFVAY